MFGDSKRNTNFAVQEEKDGQKVVSGRGARLVSYVKGWRSFNFAEHLSQADEEAKVANVSESFKHMSYQEMNEGNMRSCKKLFADKTTRGGFQETIGTPMQRIAYDYFGGVSPIVTG